MSPTLSTGFQFDTTISLGNVLTIVAATIAALAAFFRVRGKLDTITAVNQIQLDTINGIQIEIKEMRKLAEAQARFDERLIALQREVTELRHGKGFVQPA